MLAALATITARELTASEQQDVRAEALLVARIDEARCIGCTLCIQACPVDAIIGAAKQMHTVIAALCSGCELCVPACPVDCIEMPRAGRAWSAEDARAARVRYDQRNRRLAGIAGDKKEVRFASLPIAGEILDLAPAQRLEHVAKARQRARARRLAAKVQTSKLKTAAVTTADVQTSTVQPAKSAST